MRTLAVLIFSCAVGSSVMMLLSGSESAAKEPSAKVLRHVVLYKFKESVTPTQLQEVVDAFSALPKKIDTIAGFEKGTNVSTENKSEGFTHCFVVTFHDEAGRDAYLKHPAHDDYVKVVRDRREKVIVFDYWAEK
jgi:hypothetical protein